MSDDNTGDDNATDDHVGVGAAASRRLAVAAAYGSGGVGLAGALAAGVLLGQAKQARRAIPRPQQPPPRCDGRYGGHHAGEAVRLAVLGDSTAAGYGVRTAAETTGARLAIGLAEGLRRPVQVRSFAVVGSLSAGLVPQADLAQAWRPDLAVILVGANDVTHRVRVGTAVRYLAAAVGAMRVVGAEVVVGTCPDLGTIRPIQPPLRWLARRWSRDMAAAQTVAAVEAGARSVSLADLLGPTFDAQPEVMFSADRFHPSADGYGQAAAAILPALLAAAGQAPVSPASPMAGEGVRSLAQAAVQAVDQAGTVVSGTTVAGRAHGPAGRWALVLRRRPNPVGKL
jgi:lysophospholipase L1-like esterase